MEGRLPAADFTIRGLPWLYSRLALSFQPGIKVNNSHRRPSLYALQPYKVNYYLCFHGQPLKSRKSRKEKAS